MTDHLDRSLLQKFAGRWADNLIVAFVMALIFVLPIAHTAAIRSSLIVGALVVWAGKLIYQRRPFWRGNPLNLVILLVLLAAAASVFFSRDLNRTLDDIRGELIQVFLIYYLVSDTIDNAPRAKRLLYALFAISAVFSLYSIYDFIRHSPGITHLHLASVGYRAGGLRDPGGGEVAAIFHCIVIPFLLFSFMHWRHFRARVIFGVLLGLNLIALFLTYTRAGWLGFLVIGIFFLFTKTRSKLLAGTICMIGIFVLLSFPVGLVRHGEKLHKIPEALRMFVKLPPRELQKMVGGGGGIRLGIYKYVLGVIIKEPFVPHGFGLYPTSEDRSSPGNKRAEFGDPHCAFLVVAYQTGIQGLVIFFLMMGQIGRLSWRWHKEGRGHFLDYLCLSVLAMLFGFLVNISFGSFYKDDSKLLFWILIGLTVGLGKSREAAAAQPGT